MTKFRAPAKATVAEAAMTPITVTVTTAGSPEPATTDKARGRITATRPHKILATAATNENRCRVNSGGENQMNRTVPERQTSVAETIFSMRAKAVAKIRDTEPQP